ncbi:hypothetical protein IGS59_26405 [Janthinobacterium sp. GW460P]|uniref:hypothetical protein n=1 Tax=unclassified Janthinobacterium TaxID=2610881 RepID=UPI00111C0D08|nr:MULTISPECIES: hypothetical protein [unclassified Janthinobacterium]MCC7705781.1 hypothetical protein [Janthinobacterium sp. GW460P]MCC7711341.1 hypothetical protein [Janthinobacterium sp. GW460W]
MAKAKPRIPALQFVPGMPFARLYAAHCRDIVSRQVGGDIDLSRVDSMVAVRLRVTGHSQDEIAATLAACAPTVRASEERRNWKDYAVRTARYAFGPEGNRTAARLERYREQFLRLEGRHVAYEQVQDSPEPNY